MADIVDEPQALQAERTSVPTLQRERTLPPVAPEFLRRAQTFGGFISTGVFAPDGETAFNAPLPNELAHEPLKRKAVTTEFPDAVLVPPPPRTPPLPAWPNNEVLATQSERRLSKGLINHHKSLDEHKGKKSVRYCEAKTHLHYQRDTVRQYRKKENQLTCAAKCCSGKSSTGHWVDSPQAKAVAYTVIFLNTLFFFFQIYFEDHHITPESKAVDQALYCTVEMFFFCIFSVELIFRHSSTTSAEGFQWNQYDAFFLLVVFVDSCMLNFIPSTQSFHRVVVRLMPTLQVFRLGRFVQEFRMIIKGIFSAMRAVLWSVCLLAMVIYFFAVISSTCIGRSDRFESDNDVQLLFGTMPKSMLTLFTFATLEEFPDTVRHFMNTGDPVGGFIALCIIVFVLVTNLSLLNLVTAVVVDTIIDILPKKRADRIAQERAETVQRLEIIFQKMDQDGNKKLSLQEFLQGLDGLTDAQSELNLLQIATLDVRELFALIDLNETGSVSVDEFINGLLRMVPAPASKKELLGMEYDMHKMWNMLSSGQEHIMNSFADLQKGIVESVSNSLQDTQEALEKSLKESWAQMEKRLQDHLAELAEQIFARQNQLLEAAHASNTKGRLALLQRTLEALPPKCSEECRQAVEEEQRTLLQALEAKLPQPVTAAHLSAITELQRLMEELKQNQEQLASNLERQYSSLEQEGPTTAPVSRASSPVALRTRPPPLQASCLQHVSAAGDAGPEPEPHSVLQTPAAKYAISSDCQWRAIPTVSTIAEAVAPVSCRQQAPRFSPNQRPPPQFSHRPLSQYPKAETPPATTSGRLGQELARDQEQTLAASAAQSARLASIQQWVQRYNLMAVPFDKLVLHLDRLGVELSEAEQDALRYKLQQPGMGSA